MRNHIKAFTLVEILLVIIILGTVTLITLPNVSKSYQNYMFQKEIEKMVYLMRLGQTLAITEGSEYRMIIDHEDHSYWLAQPVEKNEGEEKEFARIPLPEGKKYQIPESVEISHEFDGVYFYPNGQIEKVLIEVCRDKECYLINTKEYRGYVQVVKSEEE